MFADLIEPTHLLLLLGICVVVLGPKRLPEVARSLGKSIRGFEDGISADEPELEIDA